MPFLNQPSHTQEIPPAVPAKSHAAKVAEYTAAGWTILSDGPTGTQLQGPKKMKVLDGIFLFFGVLFAMASFPFQSPGMGLIGVIMVIIALIDYGMLTKRQTAFIERA